ncbi:uncharacterized protein LOC127800160 [Diospyros lotus]|uniref:uncharacterized protein LOC127800160 n=1 Tax=Diospyros lotus TaxID=55363 RepID=UPI00225658CA|nr:uncharacterized protein LOC127800160 [Diospyros lotus]
MGRKKVKGAAKETGPSVEEVVKAFRIKPSDSLPLGLNADGSDKAIQEVPVMGVGKTKEVLAQVEVPEPCHQKIDASGPEAVGRKQSSVEKGSPTELQVQLAQMPTVPVSDAQLESAPVFDSSVLASAPVLESSPVLVDSSGAKADRPKLAPWVGLFKDYRRLDQGHMLKRYDSDQKEVSIEANEVYPIEDAWGSCLVGYVAGKFPGRGALLKLCESWNVTYQYTPHSSGWLVFKFTNDADRERVLQGGPYFVYGRPLMLKILPNCFEFDADSFCSVPVWITLPGLPIQCWHPVALGKIVSKVGKPITTDKMTATLERVSFARVLVEVDASKDLIRNVRIKLPTGKFRDQLVAYEFEPKFCVNCRVLGHAKDSCKANVQGAESREKDLIPSVPVDDTRASAGKRVVPDITEGSGGKEKGRALKEPCRQLQKGAVNVEAEPSKEVQGEQEAARAESVPVVPGLVQRIMEEAFQEQSMKKRVVVKKSTGLTTMEVAPKGMCRFKPRIGARRKKIHVDMCRVLFPRSRIRRKSS